jgi:hypothetical protein
MTVWWVRVAWRSSAGGMVSARCAYPRVMPEVIQSRLADPTGHEHADKPVQVQQLCIRAESQQHDAKTSRRFTSTSSYR